MTLAPWKWLFTWKGRVQPSQYFLTGIVLTALKFAIDSSVAAKFGEQWHIWYYAFPSRDVGLLGLGIEQPKMFLILWAIAIPFFWIGIVLTLRRLRDAGQVQWPIFLFFVPALNLVYFLCLTLLPSSKDSIDEQISPSALQKKATLNGGAFGVAIAVVLGFALAILGTQVLFLYGWGLFLGAPFLTGFVASWFLNKKTPQSVLSTVVASALTPLLIGIALLSFGREGLICLLMAVPLAIPFSVAGGLVARSMLQRRNIQVASPPTFAAFIAILPMLMLGEHAVNPEPPVLSVTTSILIDAPASVVWKNVVAFPPLAPPEEWMFQTGIAYPTSGQIVGSGVGAVRYCHFSTGDFVEPITVWDEDRLLAFNVSSQAPAMHELSPWKIKPPHVERNYMRSRHGQFRLAAVDDKHTLLEGTTWYQNYFWPQAYWQVWSDAIVHRIHLRVLKHVKQLAENQLRPQTPREE